VARKLLSEQFREQLQGLGSNLASHTRSLEDHFASQEAFLAVRHQELEEVAKEVLPASPEVEDALEIALAPLVNGDLNQLTVPELKRLCNGAGLKGYSKFKKPRLVSLLKASGITAPPVQVKKLSRSQLEAIVNALLATSGRC
jgi:hypothetical protein